MEMPQTRRKKNGQKERKRVLREMKAVVTVVRAHAQRYHRLLDENWQATDWTRPQAEAGSQAPGIDSGLSGLTSLQYLDLCECFQLSGDLSPLASLTSLRSLNISMCQQLSGDLTPLAGLTSLQSLYLFGCSQLSGGLSPLARLTALQSLDLNRCLGIRRFAPLESLLPRLEKPQPVWLQVR
jgi:hypothetical protein